MALTESKLARISAEEVQIAFRDDNGYPQGQDTTPNVKSVPQTDNAYVPEGVITIDPQGATYPKVTIFGTNVFASIPQPASALGIPTFQLSRQDELLDSFANSVTIDTTTNTARLTYGENESRRTFPFFKVSMAELVTDVDTGAYWYRHHIFPKCTLVKMVDTPAAQITGDVTNPAPVTYALDLSLDQRDINGMLFSAQDLGLERDRTARLNRRSAKRLAYTTFVADGVATTFALGYRPTSSDATGSAENNITLNGVQTAVTSVATDATKLVTLTGAGSANDIWVVEYETDFIT